MTTTDKTLILQAMTANISVMHQLLQDITATSQEGLKALQMGEQNLAIGTMHTLAERLDQARSLFAATISLHQAQ